MMVANTTASMPKTQQTDGKVDRLSSFIAYTPLQAAMDAFLLSREAMRCTEKTLIHYRYTVGAFVQFIGEQGATHPTEITAHHIRLYLVHLQHLGLKDTTQHARARGVKTWLRWLVREGDLDRNPMDRVDMPRLEIRIQQPYTKDEIHRLLAACNRSTAKGLRDYAIVLCLLDSGLRLAEFASVRLQDLDMRSGVVTVMGKGRKERQVRFGAKARGALVRWLAHANREPDEPLWGLSHHGIQVMLKRLGKRAGVPCSAHKFRRTFAVTMLRSGCDLESLRMLLGHANLVVLQRYLALSPEDIRRVHVAHSPVDVWL